MIVFFFSIFNMKKIFSIVSPPTFHLAPRSLNTYTVNVTEKYSIIYMNHRVSINQLINVKVNHCASSVTPKTFGGVNNKIIVFH